MSDRPHGFRHAIDGDRFTFDRIEALLRRAPSDRVRIRAADDGFERTHEPAELRLDGSLADALAAGRLHVALEGLQDWAPEIATLRDDVYEAAGVDRSQPLFHETCNLRVFSPGAPVALHADGETQLNCGLSGRTVWHFVPPDVLTQEEHETLLRGGQFLSARELGPTISFDLGPGDGCGAPPRWPHWLEHPGSEPAVSFELGYWTAAAVRERKVFEVNWLLRRTRLVRPRPPRAGSDALKQRAFDLISLATGKGSEFRGV